MNDVINKYTSAVVREYDRMISEMLANYRINVLDLDEVKLRVSVIETGMGSHKHFYIDGIYAFTVSSFTRAQDDWGVNGVYRLGISHKIEFLDKSEVLELEKKHGLC